LNFLSAQCRVSHLTVNLYAEVFASDQADVKSHGLFTVRCRFGNGPVQTARIGSTAGALQLLSFSDSEETKHAKTDCVGVHVAGRRHTGAGGKDEDRDGGCEHGGWTWLTGTTNIGKTFITLMQDFDAS
jgi:hypothetical protein